MRKIDPLIKCARQKKYNRAYYLARKEKFYQANLKRRTEKPDEVKAQISAWRKQQLIVAKEFRDWLKSLPCADCGQTFPPECMDFDHRDPLEKLYSVGTLLVNASSLEKLQAEVMKCDLVCANCHRIRTWKKREA